jgi:hypothetical protein
MLRWGGTVAATHVGGSGTGVAANCAGVQSSSY